MQSLKEYNLEFVFYSEWGGNHKEGLEQTKDMIWIIIFQDPLCRKINCRVVSAETRGEEVRGIREAFRRMRDKEVRNNDLNQNGTSGGDEKYTNSKCIFSVKLTVLIHELDM